MSSQEMLKRHADLVDRMAETLGLDLEEAMMRGQMQMDSLGDAVLRCTGCTQPETCESWLQAQNGEVDGAPSYCRNSEMFDLLKAGKSV